MHLPREGGPQCAGFRTGELSARLLSRHRRCSEDLLQICFLMIQVWMYLSPVSQAVPAGGGAEDIRGSSGLLQERKYLTRKMLENVIYFQVS